MQTMIGACAVARDISSVSAPESCEIEREQLVLALKVASNI